MPFVSLFCQLLREPSGKQNHGFHSEVEYDITKAREMVLVGYERTWTIGLCSFYFLFNMVGVETFNVDEKKDGKVFQKHYRFEDFFWTGSEDDVERENSFHNETDAEINLIESSIFETWRTTTVFHTTTILFATVYPNTDSCKSAEHGCTPQVSPVQTKSIEFSLPTFVPEVSEILPCPTQKVPQTNTFEFPSIFSDGDEAGVSGGTSTTTGTPRVFTSKQTKSRNGSVFPEANFGEHNVPNTTVFPLYSLDQKYWILTVLRNDNFSRNLELNSTENKLSTLYKKALNRRQEKYFGSDFQNKKDQKLSQPVKVNILNVTRVGKNLEIIYCISVAGEPVPAMTAANDMRLMTASEVIAELGYPILSKAEPYIKNYVPLGARVKGRTRDTWLFIGSVIAAVLLLIILAALFALALSKKQTRQERTKEIERRKNVFKEEEGSRNLAFEGDDDMNAKGLVKSSQRNQTKHKELQGISHSAGASIKFTSEDRRGSTTSSSCSNSSEASLVRLRHQQKKKEKRMKEFEDKPKPKPRTRIRRIENSDGYKNEERRAMGRTSSAISRNTFNELIMEGTNDQQCSPCMTRSPTSYLSMPSVRAFPRGTQIPEPLNKVLEPISIRHFDADSDSPNEYQHSSQVRHKVDIEQICEVKNKSVKRKTLTRHASLEGDDPGFIGPVVWNRRFQKVGETETDGVNIDEVDENVNIGRMRKRFNELLDDALSMFGSRNPSPDGVEEGSVKQFDHRIHSAVVRPAGLLSGNIAGSRPKTTGSRRPQSAVISGPRGAWETPSCSTLHHSETAVVFKKLSSSPNIDRDLINVNSELAPCDPAVPLIAAIKNELKKFEEPSCNE